MPVNGLTKAEARVLKWLIGQEVYVAPVTVREVAASMGANSPNAAMRHLKALEKKGWIKRGSGARQVRILKHPEAEP